MAEFTRALDVFQGFNFKKDVVAHVGFITTMKIGDVTLDPDMEPFDPMAPTTALKVVSVLSGIQWSIGQTDAVYFSGVITAANKQKVVMMTYKDLTKVEVDFKFKIYEYDPLKKQYFLSFHCNDTEMKGIAEKRGKDLTLGVADEPGTIVQSPENFNFHIGIKAAPVLQNLNLATSVTNKVVKEWGIKGDSE